MPEAGGLHRNAFERDRNELPLLWSSYGEKSKTETGEEVANRRAPTRIEGESNFTVASVMTHVKVF